MLPIKDLHGVHIRSEKYPLKVGDEFNLFSSQVTGYYRGNPHYAISGRYVVEHVHGLNGGELILFRTDYDGPCDRFHCSTHGVYAILGKWSNYVIADEVAV